MHKLFRPSSCQYQSSKSAALHWEYLTAVKQLQQGREERDVQLTEQLPPVALHTVPLGPCDREAAADRDAGWGAGWLLRCKYSSLFLRWHVSASHHDLFWHDHCNNKGFKGLGWCRVVGLLKSPFPTLWFYDSKGIWVTYSGRQIRQIIIWH